jgi:nucleotide-binding universal stress UspA family protein
MKTILVPTDYSDAAENAMQYALRLARLSHSKIILLHVYQLPVPLGEVPMVIVSPAEIIDAEEQQIKKIRESVVASAPGEIVVETLLRTGLVREQIIAVAEEQNADLIVMGMTGSNVNVVRMMGNVTTGVFKKTEIPVLVIPKSAQFREIRRIALAHDRKIRLSPEAVESVKFFTSLFKAELVVINVTDPLASASEKELKTVSEIEASLDGLPSSIVIDEEESVTQGIESFVEHEHCDWLVMTPHRHRSAVDLFHQSATKQIAFETSVPLLAIHD